MHFDRPEAGGARIPCRTSKTASLQPGVRAGYDYPGCAGYRGEDEVARRINAMPFPDTTAQTIEAQAEPAWEIATIFPLQGAWSEADYLSLNTNHLVEFSHGRVEVLPMPTQSHQLIVLFLYRLLYE